MTANQKRTVRFPAIRVPAELKAKLEKMARHYDAMQTLGKCNVPSHFADPRGGHVGTPVWFVIERALAELADKRQRSNRKRPKSR